MKKLLSLLFIVVTMNTLSVKAQSEWWWLPEQTWEDGVNAVGVELNGQVARANLGRSSGLTAGINCYIYGFYLSFSSNFSEAEEKQWGAGDQIDDEHNIKSIAIGHNFILAQSMDYEIGITPMFTCQIVEDRLVDAYYGEDKVVGTHTKIGGGIGFTFRNDSFIGQIKLTSTEIGLSVSFIPAMLWDYYWF